MQGDYHRYMAELQHKGAAEAAKAAYERALTAAATKLAKTSPIRLGLALNYSGTPLLWQQGNVRVLFICFHTTVFMFEIAHEAAAACKLAKSAFDGAVSELDLLDETDYKDATLLLQVRPRVVVVAHVPVNVMTQQNTFNALFLL